MQLRRPVSQAGRYARRALPDGASDFSGRQASSGVVALAPAPSAAAQTDLVLRLTQWGIAWFARIFQTQRLLTHAEADSRALQAGALRLCASGTTAAAAMEATA